MSDSGLDKITERIIGCAYKVSNTLGIGFVEKVYENALFHEMKKDGLKAVRQHLVKVNYDGIVVGEFYLDFLVNDFVLVELKAASALTDDHLAQAFNYLRATDLGAFHLSYEVVTQPKVTGCVWNGDL